MNLCVKFITSLSVYYQVAIEKVKYATCTKLTFCVYCLRYHCCCGNNYFQINILLPTCATTSNKHA